MSARMAPALEMSIAAMAGSIQSSSSRRRKSSVLMAQISLSTSRNRPDAIRYTATVIDRVRDLAREHDDEDIAALFNREGLRSSTGKSFTASMISWIRFKHRIPGPPRPPGTFSVNEVCERYGVSMHVVYYWIERGHVS